jgi:penicillin-binding protein 1A
MKRATARRNVVLQRMADERYITQAQADDAKRTPIVTRGQPNQALGVAPFFVEEVRKHLERQYGAKVLYESGLAVTTTLDARLQELAGQAEAGNSTRVTGFTGIWNAAPQPFLRDFPRRCERADT